MKLLTFSLDFIRYIGSSLEELPRGRQSFKFAFATTVCREYTPKEPKPQFCDVDDQILNLLDVGCSF